MRAEHRGRDLYLNIKYEELLKLVDSNHFDENLLKNSQFPESPWDATTLFEKVKCSQGDYNVSLSFERGVLGGSFATLREGEVIVVLSLGDYGVLLLKSLVVVPYGEGDGNVRIGWGLSSD